MWGRRPSLVIGFLMECIKVLLLLRLNRIPSHRILTFLTSPKNTILSWIFANQTDMVGSHYKNTLSRLMKLYDRTPDSEVYFLAGSLPFLALLHLRQLSLFDMICHLQDNVLNSLATTTLIEGTPSSRSWFQTIRNILIQYELPNALLLLSNPMPSVKFKKLCRLKVSEL